MTIEQVAQIAVPVKEMQRAVAFYKEKLRLTLLFEMETMAFFDCNGLRLLLSLPENETYAQASSVIYFRVASIHESYVQLTAAGVTFVGAPHMVAKMGNVETWMAFFNDGEGNVQALMSEVPVNN